MKESVAYKIAQCSVLNDNTLKDHEKLAVLRILMDRENLALFAEKEMKKEGEE